MGTSLAPTMLPNKFDPKLMRRDIPSCFQFIISPRIDDSIMLTPDVVKAPRLAAKTSVAPPENGAVIKAPMLTSEPAAAPKTPLHNSSPVLP